MRLQQAEAASFGGSFVGDDTGADWRGDWLSRLEAQHRRALARGRAQRQRSPKGGTLAKRRPSLAPFRGQPVTLAGPDLRIQAPAGQRPATMRLDDGLYVVAMVPERAAQIADRFAGQEIGVWQVLAPILAKKVAKKLKGHIKVPKKLKAKRTPSAASLAEQLNMSPEMLRASLAVLAQLPWQHETNGGALVEEIGAAFGHCYCTKHRYVDVPG